MISKSVYKVPNGKLVKITLNYNVKNKKILDIRITGDFFVYPEEAIEIIEKRLINEIINEKTLKDIIENVNRENRIEFIGLNAEGLITGILKCLK